MSALVPFDTLKFVETLEAGGFTHVQAKAAAQAFADATGEELATKSDLASTRGELKAEITATRAELKAEIAAVKAELKTEIAAVRTELKTDIAAVKAELRQTELRLEGKIESVKAEMIKWMFGTIGFQTLIIVGAVVTLARAAHP
jgi:phenylalanyl-tRNA synthetase alpha subunit